ncbi:GNAT family N-acetyltransferase [Falsirhodobacter deserti]|uniref:GNAT family N-acetyltransferase n=1 Tax=Falsirhodobacter deserti TaxID=1365611 RepID=UPI0013E39BD2|nr:GNAT family N-acetyltransferase [Falsirhodobacter deserti]
MPVRGLGIGRRLLQTVIDAARQAGAIRPEWQTPRWNTAAIRFYQQSAAELLEKERFRLPL